MCRRLLYMVIGCLLLCDGAYGQAYHDIDQLSEYLFNGTRNKNIRPLLDQRDIVQVCFFISHFC